MTPEEFKEFVRERIAAREALCESIGTEVKGTDATMTLIGRAFKGIGVRPEIVDWHQNGEKTALFTYDQCQRMLKKMEA